MANNRYIDVEILSDIFCITHQVFGVDNNLFLWRKAYTVTPVFSVTWSFRNIYYYDQFWRLLLNKLIVV